MLKIKRYLNENNLKIFANSVIILSVLSFYISVVYISSFFYHLGIDTRYIPLTLSDYTLGYKNWFIYIIIVLVIVPIVLKKELDTIFSEQKIYTGLFDKDIKFSSRYKIKFTVASFMFLLAYAYCSFAFNVNISLLIVLVIVAVVYMIYCNLQHSLCVTYVFIILFFTASIFDIAQLEVEHIYKNENTAHIESVNICGEFKMILTIENGVIVFSKNNNRYIVIPKEKIHSISFMKY